MFPSIISSGWLFKFSWMAAVWASLVAQMVRNLPAMHKTQVRSLGQEDPLEKGMATHSSTLAWRIPWTEEPDRLSSPWGRQELDTTEWLTLLLSINIPMINCFFYGSIYVPFKFYFQHYHFLFLCPSVIVVGQFTLLLHFHTMACGFTKRRQRNNIPAGFDFCVWTSNRCIVTNPR